MAKACSTFKKADCGLEEPRCYWDTRCKQNECSAYKQIVPKKAKTPQAPKVKKTVVPKASPKPKSLAKPKAPPLKAIAQPVNKIYKIQLFQIINDEVKAALVDNYQDSYKKITKSGWKVMDDVLCCFFLYIIRDKRKTYNEQQLCSNAVSSHWNKLSKSFNDHLSTLKSTPTDMKQAKIMHENIQKHITVEITPKGLEFLLLIFRDVMYDLVKLSNEVIGEDAMKDEAGMLKTLQEHAEMDALLSIADMDPKASNNDTYPNIPYFKFSTREEKKNELNTYSKHTTLTDDFLDAIDDFTWKLTRLILKNPTRFTFNHQRLIMFMTKYKYAEIPPSIGRINGQKLPDGFHGKIKPFLPEGTRITDSGYRSLCYILRTIEKELIERAISVNKTNKLTKKEFDNLMKRDFYFYNLCTAIKRMRKPTKLMSTSTLSHFQLIPHSVKMYDATINHNLSGKFSPSVKKTFWDAIDLIAYRIIEKLINSKCNPKTITSSKWSGLTSHINKSLSGGYNIPEFNISIALRHQIDLSPECAFVIAKILYQVLDTILEKTIESATTGVEREKIRDKVLNATYLQKYIMGDKQLSAFVKSLTKIKKEKSKE